MVATVGNYVEYSRNLKIKANYNIKIKIVIIYLIHILFLTTLKKYTNYAKLSICFIKSKYPVDKSKIKLHTNTKNKYVNHNT